MAHTPGQADRLLNARMSTEEAFAGTLAVINSLSYGSQSEVIRSAASHRYEQPAGLERLSRQLPDAPDQFLNSFLSWNQNFAAHVTNFFTDAS